MSTVNLLNLQSNRRQQVANDYKDQQLVYAVRSDNEQAKAKQKACEKGYIQSERLNTAHTEMANIKRQKTQPISEAEQADKITSTCNTVRNHSEQAREKQKTRKRHYIQKKRLDTAYKKLKTLRDEKHNQCLKQNMQIKSQNARLI